MLQTIAETSNVDATPLKQVSDHLDTATLANLIACMEIAAYSLVRSGESAAANVMFYAVADLEKIKSSKTELVLVS